MKFGIEFGTHAKQVDNLRAQLAEVQTELTASSEKVKNLQDQRTEVQAKLEQFKDDALNLGLDLGTHAKEADRLRAQLAEVQTELTASSEKVKNLQDQRTEVQAKLIGSYEEIKNLHVQLAELQAKLAESNKEVKSQQDQIRGLRVEKDSIKTDLVGARKTIKSQSDKIQVQAQGLKRELDRVYSLEREGGTRMQVVQGGLFASKEWRTVGFVKVNDEIVLRLIPDDERPVTDILLKDCYPALDQHSLGHNGDSQARIVWVFSMRLIRCGNDEEDWWLFPNEGHFEELLEVFRTHFFPGMSNL
ncbi:hypothetical protein FB567DRAFT_612872 [Paraphoma chrysanthemicola]|uniref:Chromosome partition protein Smc n=1 Tax=Paraphoma chrysanthemicola TaxID=798071 RepID=A0A8K0QVH9_9PLEO|nr:hypothetical protein FB567DRAFT_612872 [Paraphoma chrysanthemicola]